jgi:hypothetical protein
MNGERIKKLITSHGNTQLSERISIEIVKEALNNLSYSFIEAGSQQSKDFRNVCNIGLNIEVKKCDNTTIYFNDTCPSSNIYYIIIFTGKEYKTKENIPPTLIFINGYELIKKDIYFLIDFKKDLEIMRNKWCRKTKNQNANKLKYMSTYFRPTYKRNISDLLSNPVYSNVIN